MSLKFTSYTDGSLVEEGYLQNFTVAIKGKLYRCNHCNKFVGDDRLNTEYIIKELIPGERTMCCYHCRAPLWYPPK